MSMMEWDNFGVPYMKVETVYHLVMTNIAIEHGDLYGFS